MDVGYIIATAVLAFLGGLAGSGLRSYMTEKGKNLAASEDLDKLTRIAEDIKNTNALALASLTESLRAHQSMRSAAIEKRLEVHQDALRMGGLMFQKLYGHPDEHHQLGIDLRDWWMRNALYLDPEPRAAFDKAWSAFLRHPTLSSRDWNDDPERAIKNFAHLQALTPALERAVALPPIVLTEAKLGASAEGAVVQEDKHM